MKVLVTGGQGQLGRDVEKLLMAKGHEVTAPGREQLDVTCLEQVTQVVSALKPQVIIHTAAYTQVDKAEEEVDLAYAVNAFGTRNVALAAEQNQAKLVYISTDYVFDGKATQPYREFDPPNPQSIYGKSKLAGEQMVLQFCARPFIVRTSWVYGAHGNNFVKTMLRLAQMQHEVNVVSDQVGSPTYTVDLARFLAQLVESDLYGIYHASNTGQCSWAEFAQAIFEEADLTHVKVNPITTEQYPRPALRPAYSVLDHMAIRVSGFEDLRHWREGLEEVFYIFSFSFKMN